MQSVMFTVDRVAAAEPDEQEWARIGEAELDRDWNDLGEFAEVECLTEHRGHVDRAGAITGQLAAWLDPQKEWQKTDQGYFALGMEAIGAQAPVPEPMRRFPV